MPITPLAASQVLRMASETPELFFRSSARELTMGTISANASLKPSRVTLLTAVSSEELAADQVLLMDSLAALTPTR